MQLVSPEAMTISFQDRQGTPRVTGEEWIVKQTGAYLPGAYEDVLEMVDAYVLTEKVRIASFGKRCNLAVSMLLPTYIEFSFIFRLNAALLFISNMKFFGNLKLLLGIGIGVQSSRHYNLLVF